MAQSIKISDDDIDFLRKEAQLSSRSIAGQAEHWMRIGRAIEQSPSFNYQHIRNVLSGLTNPDDLSVQEQEVFFEEFADSMSNTTPEQKTFFAKRRKEGLGVGLDENDRLIFQNKSQK